MLFYYTFTAQQHLTKTIEVTRINLFNIINQYKAIFPEEDSLTNETLPNTISSQKPLQGVSCDGSRLFQSWLNEKVGYQQQIPSIICLFTYLHFRLTIS